jgi:hypothetical protein
VYTISYLFLFHLQALQIHSLNVLPFSTYNFHLLRSWMQPVQFFIFNFFISFIISSSHLFFGLPIGHVNVSFHLYTFFTILSSAIQCKWPNQLNICAFMLFIIFLCRVNPSLVLILHVPSLSFVGPKILLYTFLTKTFNLFSVVSFKTHASQPYVIYWSLFIYSIYFMYDFGVLNYIEWRRVSE